MNMHIKKIKPLALAVSFALAGQVIAQTDEQQVDSPEAEKSTFEQIIVIGNMQKRLIEASVPFSQITEEQIARQAPRNISDALTNIPSLQVENTSGNTNNEYRFRGVGAGGTQFLEFEEDGIPIMRDAPDFLYRVSNATGGIDTIRGGNAPILRTAAVGAVINFRHKEATQEQSGDVFFQTSDFGMFRTELWLGGPINEQLEYTLAGYYTTDDGVREVDFPANEGYNLHGSLKYHFEDGSGHFKMSGRTFEENNIVYLAVPLRGDPANPEQFPGGPDITTGSLLSREIALSNTFSAPNEPSVLDLLDGNASDMTYLGTELKKNWDLKDGSALEFTSRNRYTSVSSRFSGYYAAGFALGGDFQTGESLVPNMLNTNTMGAGLVNYSYALPEGFAPTGYTVTNQQGAVLDNGTIADTNGNGIIDAGEASSTATSLANGNGIFMPVAAFDQDNPFTSFQQDLELAYSFDTDNAEHYVSAGYYYMKMDREQDNRQQLFLIDLRPQAGRVDVNLQNANGDQVTLTDDGFLTHNHWLNREAITDEINAFYVDYEIKFDQLTLDVGARHDEFSNIIQRANTVNFFGDGPNQVALPEPGTTVSPAVSAIQRYDGSFRTDQDFTTKEWSYTFGANYLVQDNFALYGRYTEAHLPNPRGATGTDVMELGARYDGGDFTISSNIFRLTQDGDIQERGLTIDGQEVIAQFQTDRESVGLEIEAVWDITDALSLNISGTYQKPEFASGGSATPRPGFDVTQDQLDAAIGDLTSIDGNQIANQPELLGNLGLDYEWTLGDYGYLNFNVVLRYVDEVPLDDANSNYTESYTQVNTGLNFESLEGDWYARINVQNLTDEESIQRVFGGPQSIVEQSVAADGFYGRPLLGRNVVFGVGYRF